VELLRRRPEDERLIQGPSESAPDGRASTRRLSWLIQTPQPFDPATLTATISHPNNTDVQWFCDANVFVAPTDDELWRALLAAKDRLVLALPIYHELKICWLRNPDNNLTAHAAVIQSLSGEDGAVVRLLDAPRDDAKKLSAMEYYINLLGIRKKASVIAQEKYKEKHGRYATNQELSNFIKDELGVRAQLIARKGEKAGVAEHKFNDEALIVAAIFDALYSGRETAILTYDEDVLEQFYKAIWLIDTHYRGMLFAAQYVCKPSSFEPTKQIRNEAFEGDVILLPKPSSDLSELLPTKWSPVVIHCVLVKNGQVTAFGFCAEKEMAKLLDVKAETQGLNTNLLDGRNCHVFLGDLFVENYGNWAGIGMDCASSPNGSSFKLSLVDVNLAIMPDERSTRMRVVDPNTLLLPRGYRD
jgi:hypothetical protein